MKYLKKIRKYDKIVCVSQDIVNDVVKFSHELKDKTICIYNPFDFDKIISLSDEEFTSAEKVLLDEKFILMVSRIDLDSKDFPTLIKAFEMAKDAGYDGKLYIIGDGTELPKLIEIVDSSKHSSDIKCLGSKPNPYN